MVRTVPLAVLLLACAETASAFTAPSLLAATRARTAAGPRLCMLTAKNDGSVVSMLPVLKMGGAAAGRAAGSSKVGLRLAPSDSYLNSLNAGGAGGGNKYNGGGGGGGGGGGDDNNNLPAEIVAILGAKNIAASALPKDLAAAVVAGRVGAAEIAAWAELQAGVFRKIFAAMDPSGGIRNRIMANDRFMLVMLLELGIGCVSKMAAEWRERNSRGAFWKELDFVASDMALEIIGDFALVYLLSPASAVRAPAVAGVGKMVGALPAHFMAKGSFTAAQRAGALVYKGVLFWMVGLTASIIGHTTTVTLMKARGADTSALAPVLDNSIQWANFMGVSSNLRYQLVNGWEAHLLPQLPLNKALDTLVTFAVRFGNSYVGGEMWIWWARFVGLQGDKPDKDKKRRRRDERNKRN
jgi:hypothetical protein